MSYQESNGVVTLTMCIEDYERILMALGTAAGCASRDGYSMVPWLEVADHINKGNPNWRPYTSLSRPERKALLKKKSLNFQRNKNVEGEP